MARTTLIYGVSTSRKTSQVKDFSKYIYERTGKPTYYMTGDGGSWEVAKSEVMAGLIKVLRISSNVVPLSVIRKISQGYWLDAGEVVGTEKLPNVVPINWDKCGGMFIEGLTAFGTIVMNFLADKGIKLNEDPVGKFGQSISVDGKETVEFFGNSARSHYQFVHTQLSGIVKNLSSLPCDMVVVTALEKKGDDDDDKSKATVIGPDVPGKAITGTVPAWFENCLNHQFHKGEDGKIALRAHFRTFLDDLTGIPIKCKTSLSKEGLLKLQGTLRDGWYDLDGFTLADYLRMVDTLNVAEVDPLREWRRKMDEKLGRGPAGGQKGGGK